MENCCSETKEGRNQNEGILNEAKWKQGSSSRGTKNTNANRETMRPFPNQVLKTKTLSSTGRRL